jgi:hypothetical protein
LNIQTNCKDSQFFDQGADIEFITGLVNKKELLQEVKAVKIDPNIPAALYLGSGGKKSPLCCGNFNQQSWNSGVLE